jgi:integrase
MWKDEQTSDERSKVFAVFAPNKAAKMLRKDLEAAGIAYKDDAGRYVDFHSLRHTFISNLTRSGVSPKIAQSLARHSTIGLTMDTYTHIGLYDERAAIDSLPKLPDLDMNERRADEAVAVRTGTDDVEITSDKSAYKKCLL